VYLGLHVDEGHYRDPAFPKFCAGGAAALGWALGRRGGGGVAASGGRWQGASAAMPLVFPIRSYSRSI
jgi:hypothetical protein